MVVVRLKSVSAIALVLALVLTACGKEKAAGDLYGEGNGPLGISLDASIPIDQARILYEDLEEFSEMEIPNPSNPQYAQLVGVPDFSASSLVSWLQKRVRVVVGETFDYDSLKVAAEQRRYSPQIIANERESVSKIQTVMFNLGSWLYLSGKESSVVYELPVMGTTMRVASPRVGIIQIGEGLFDANSVKGSDVRALVNQFLRIAVFFHEARHADGNGTNAAFPHSKCTSGDYAGNHSCESNLNGPYVVEAILLRQFYDICNSCSASEKDSLRAFIADNIGRLQKGATQKDERPEGI